MAMIMASGISIERWDEEELKDPLDQLLETRREVYTSKKEPEPEPLAFTVTLPDNYLERSSNSWLGAAVVSGMIYTTDYKGNVLKIDPSNDNVSTFGDLKTKV